MIRRGLDIAGLAAAAICKLPYRPKWLEVAHLAHDRNLLPCDVFYVGGVLLKMDAERVREAITEGTISDRIWFYTSYQCNLARRYRLTWSSPHVAPTENAN